MHLNAVEYWPILSTLRDGELGEAKKDPEIVHIWVKISIQNLVLAVSRNKKL